MRLWRVIMSVRVTGGELPFAYDYTRNLQTFYIHAAMASDASVQAIRLVASSASPRDEYRTSGSVVEVGSDLEPIRTSAGNLNERSWDDGTHATVNQAPQ